MTALPPRQPGPTIPFRCPICRCQVYKLFAPVPRSTPRSPVYECHGCSVLFTDPERFTRFDPHPTANMHPAPDFTRGWRSSGSSSKEARGGSRERD